MKVAKSERMNAEERKLTLELTMAVAQVSKVCLSMAAEVQDDTRQRDLVKDIYKANEHINNVLQIMARTWHSNDE